MTWVIQRNEPAANGHPMFVNQPGSEKSYTTNIDRARTFDSEESARKQCCGNERPRRL